MLFYCEIFLGLWMILVMELPFANILNPFTFCVRYQLLHAQAYLIFLLPVFLGTNSEQELLKETSYFKHCYISMRLVDTNNLILVAANGICNKHIGKHPTHSILFIGSGSIKEGNERSILQLFEPWRRVLRRTDGSSVWSKPWPVELGFPLLCHACLCCWPLIASISYTKTHVYCGKTNFGLYLQLSLPLLSDICLNYYSHHEFPRQT